MRVEILAVCGSNGSWLLPVREKLVGNIEPRSVFHTPNQEQWRLNFGDIPFYKSPKELFLFPNVIVGAPDCGSSSMMALTRSKGFSNPLENDSFNMFFSSIQEMQPDLFFMENLPKAKESVKSIAWLKQRYHLHFLIGPVTLFGNSQKGRVRIITMGIHKDFPMNHKFIWNHISRLTEVKPKTCRELLRGLTSENYSTETGHVTEDLDETITIYAGCKMKLKKIKSYWDKNSNLKRFESSDRKYQTAPGVYRNLPDEYPQVARKANRQFNSEGIQMSPRELARIQGIPDTFRIKVESDNLKYWINKGRATVAKCPPYEIGLWISQSIDWIYNHQRFKD